MHFEVSSGMASKAIHFPSLYPRDQNSDLLSSGATALISTAALTSKNPICMAGRHPMHSMLPMQIKRAERRFIRRVDGEAKAPTTTHIHTQSNNNVRMSRRKSGEAAALRAFE
jgi:hypothetical protein